MKINIEDLKDLIYDILKLDDNDAIVNIIYKALNDSSQDIRDIKDIEKIVELLKTEQGG